ncbi:MAG: VanW family protein [Clostridiales bacterium]|nr:VanW family protein [Clostridiales bacterium]
MPNAVTTSAANMRSRAGICFNVIKTLSAETAVTIEGKELGWFKVEAGGTIGYITDTLLKVTDPKIAEQYNPVKSNYQKLSSYTTRFSASDVNRNHNMELGGYKNNVIVKSGASFSFNKNTGNSTTTANGWRESIILVNSVRTKGIGGGICQCSSTIYSAVKQVSKLTILERHPHSVPVGYVPVANEAMVNYGTSDFRFRNDNSFDIFTFTAIDHAAGALTSSIYRINPIQQTNPSVEVDGKRLSFNVPPTIIDSRVYVEMRSIFEFLGFSVSYEPASKATSMKKGGLEFLLENGSDSKNIIRIDNGIRKSIPITYPVIIISDRTMLALRFVGELTGYEVGWDAGKYAASLKTQSK